MLTYLLEGTQTTIPKSNNINGVLNTVEQFPERARVLRQYLLDNNVRLKAKKAQALW